MVDYGFYRMVGRKDEWIEKGRDGTDMDTTLDTSAPSHWKSYETRRSTRSRRSECCTCMYWAHVLVKHRRKQIMKSNQKIP